MVFVTPSDFATCPCPTYPSVRLALFPGKGVEGILRAAKPDTVHIATEGPIGHAARSVCCRLGIPFTSSFHTLFPEYIRARVPFPVGWSYSYLRRYHGRAARTFVATPSLAERLRGRGFTNLAIWSRGVDTNLFKPDPKSFLPSPRPLSMYMGRVAVEKNVEAFLDLDLPGTKYVVGDGPDLNGLRSRYPDVRFVGQKLGDELAAHVAAADVFVFPSLTDTFGLVMLEAMACGVPVAAFPVTGPLDVGSAREDRRAGPRPARRRNRCSGARPQRLCRVRQATHLAGVDPALRFAAGARRPTPLARRLSQRGSLRARTGLPSAVFIAVGPPFRTAQSAASPPRAPAGYCRWRSRAGAPRSRVSASPDRLRPSGVPPAGLAPAVLHRVFLTFTSAP